MTQETKLKPCPFCGGDDVGFDCMSQDANGKCMDYSPECRECGATILTPKPAEPFTKAQAITAWNTRASTEAADALLREARKLIEADRLIEAGKARRGEIVRCPVRQLCDRIDTHLNATQGASHEQG